jgi:hypothetical protein
MGEERCAHPLKPSDETALSIFVRFLVRWINRDAKGMPSVK